MLLLWKRNRFRYAITTILCPTSALPSSRCLRRDCSKLLVCDGGRISHTQFRSLPSLLPEGALMVFNNTRVIQARLHFRKGEAQDGALIEVFLLEPAKPVEYQENFLQRGISSWYCLVGNLKKWKEGRLSRDFEIQNSKFQIPTHGGAHRHTWHEPGDTVLLGCGPNLGGGHRCHRRTPHTLSLNTPTGTSQK